MNSFSLTLYCAHTTCTCSLPQVIHHHWGETADTCFLSQVKPTPNITIINSVPESILHFRELGILRMRIAFQKLSKLVATLENVFVSVSSPILLRLQQTGSIIGKCVCASVNCAGVNAFRLLIMLNSDKNALLQASCLAV